MEFAGGPMETNTGKGIERHNDAAAKSNMDPQHGIRIRNLIFLR